MPANGSARTTGPRRTGFVHASRTIDASARTVSLSARDKPEPSTIRTPSSGTPASASVSSTTSAPFRLVPAPRTSAPSSFSRISAV